MNSRDDGGMQEPQGLSRPPARLGARQGDLAVVVREQPVSARGRPGLFHRLLAGAPAAHPARGGRGGVRRKGRARRNLRPPRGPDRSAGRSGGGRGGPQVTYPSRRRLADAARRGGPALRGHHHVRADADLAEPVLGRGAASRTQRHRGVPDDACGLAGPRLRDQSRAPGVGGDGHVRRGTAALRECLGGDPDHRGGGRTRRRPPSASRRCSRR